MKCLLALFGITTSALAATSGIITLQGVVPKVVAVTVTGVPPFNALDLTTTQTNLPVANINEQSNDTNGYTVTAASANDGQLKNGAVGSIAYTARYNAVSFALTVTPVTITTVAGSVAVVNVTKSLTISYTGTPSASNMSGTYSDTLTFTIAAN